MDSATVLATDVVGYSRLMQHVARTGGKCRQRRCQTAVAAYTAASARTADGRAPCGTTNFKRSRYVAAAVARRRACRHSIRAAKCLLEGRFADAAERDALLRDLRLPDEF